MTANELKNTPFPDCCKDCDLLDLLGASECDSVCPEKFINPKELIKDLIRSVQVLCCDIDGNHKYMLGHRSHQVITKMRAYLDEAEQAGKG